MAFRFVHTGDLHLDSPFVGLTSEAPPGVVQTLREATIRAWDTVVDLALAEQVDFFLVAGDAFEQANRTLRGQLAFRDGLARLADARNSARSSTRESLAGTRHSLCFRSRRSPRGSVQCRHRRGDRRPAR